MQTMWQKERTFKFRTKNAFFFFFFGGGRGEAVEGVEGGWNWKNLLLYKMSKLKFVKKVSFMLRNLRIYGQRYLIWVFLGWNMKKLLLCLKWAPSNIINFKKGSSFSPLFLKFRVRVYWIRCALFWNDFNLALFLKWLHLAPFIKWQQSSTFF